VEARDLQPATPGRLAAAAATGAAGEGRAEQEWDAAQKSSFHSGTSSSSGRISAGRDRSSVLCHIPVP
jgi:hypothetical protein